MGDEKLKISLVKDEATSTSVVIIPMGSISCQSHSQTTRSPPAIVENLKNGINPVAGTFTSSCPQQPSNVYVNCNNAANPFPNFPNFPGRTRALDVDYNKPPPGSKLHFVRDTSRSSEESRESEESGESSEEMHGQYQYSPLSVLSQRPIPPIYTNTKVDNRLDFKDYGRILNQKKLMNNLRSVSRNTIPSQTNPITVGQIATGSGTVPVASTVFDETHGHGHSGQYNHAAPETSEHSHEYGQEHEHAHKNGQGFAYVHIHNHMHGQIPSHLVPIIQRPLTTISGTHMILERPILSPEEVTSSGTERPLMGSQEAINMDHGNSINDGNTNTRQYSHAMDLLRDTHDSFTLTRKKFKAVKTPHQRTFELHPQDLLNRVVTYQALPSVFQNEMDTVIDCEQIPVISEIPRPEVAHSTLSEPVSSEELEEPNLNDPISMVNSLSQTEILPEQQLLMLIGSVSSVSISEHTDKRPIESSTVTKVTTTNAEEQPIKIKEGETVVEEMSTQIGGSTGSTVTKVTTTKVDERPTVENFVHKIPVQTGSTTSTITKVTTTTVEKQPMLTDNAMQNMETLMGERPAQTGFAITKVTTTKSEDMPGVETIVHEKPMVTGSTVTKVTTTTVEERPMLTDNVLQTTGTVVREKLAQTGSDATKVTTTKSENLPGVETIDNEKPMVTGSSVTKVTTTRVEERPMTANIEHEVPEVISEVLPLASNMAGIETSFDEIVDTSKLTGS